MLTTSQLYRHQIYTMTTQHSIILVLCIFNVPFYQGREETENHLERRQISIIDVKCRKVPGFQVYKEGSTRMCLHHGQNFITYTEAKSYCASIGSRLAVFNTRDKFKIVLPMNNVWIGLDDMETEGTYKWADGSTLEQSLISFIFYPNEPNAAYDDEDCVCNNCYENFLKLVDMPCYRNFTYLCEKVF
ncbi:CD209 antigen-like protein D [Biomphalaria pfeifferi]|uniref:CD209 antigen-like protein D n=1 Tax=Biomphalaria pfeifferi TaxID=112525 RepID=A0AAD8BNX1_BIOPF|nr:CD209 antigen-like protein D [Biomphalaria pfeifferi]